VRTSALITTVVGAIVGATGPRLLRAQTDSPPAARAIFTGRLTNSLDSTPVRSADIRLVFVDSARAIAGNKDSVEIFADTARSRVGVTDTSGTFTMRRLAEGHYLMHIRRIGFEPIDGFLTVDTGTVQASFTMQVMSRVLSKVTVTESAVDVVKQRLDRNGYLSRSRMGLAATFIDRKEILRRQPQTVADILSAYGIHDSGEFQLDRMPVDYDVLRDYPADLVIGVEIYRHGRPTEYNMTRRGPSMMSRGGSAASMQPMVLIWTYIP
jgi:hypothetical protein